MKKASKILFGVSGGLSIFFFCLFLALSITFFVFGANKEWIIEGLKNGSITTTFEGTLEEKAQIVGLLLGITGFTIAFLSLFNILSAIISILAFKKPTKTLAILNIVFGALSGTTTNIIAAIFYFIGYRNEENQTTAE